MNGSVCDQKRAVELKEWAATSSWVPACGSLLYLVVVGRVSQQAAEGDGVGDASQVDEEHGRDGLNVETLVEIAR